MRDRCTLRFGGLRGYDLYRGDFRWLRWLHDDTSNGSGSVGALQIADVDCAGRSPVEYESDGAKIDRVHAALDKPLDGQAQRLHHDLRRTERRSIRVQQPMEGTRRNRGGARTARNLQREILIPVGGVVRLCGLPHAERQRLVPFCRERRRIHHEAQSRAERVPYQPERDRRRSGAADERRQLTRGDDPVRRNGTLNRQRDDRGREAFLIVLDEDPLGILVLRTRTRYRPDPTPLRRRDPATRPDTPPGLRAPLAPMLQGGPWQSPPGWRAASRLQVLSPMPIYC